MGRWSLHWGLDPQLQWGPASQLPRTGSWSRLSYPQPTTPAATTPALLLPPCSSSAHTAPKSLSIQSPRHRPPWERGAQPPVFLIITAEMSSSFLQPLPKLSPQHFVSIPSSRYCSAIRFTDEITESQKGLLARGPPAMNGAGFKPSSSCSEARAVTQPLLWLFMRSLF